MKKRTVIIEIISALLLLLFLYTALSKLYEHNGFRYALTRSPLLHPFAGLLSWSIPLVELAVAAALFIPASRIPALWASLILLTAFTGYLLYMVYFTGDRPCTCGGVISKMSWREHIVFNLFFIGLTIAGIILVQKSKRTPP